HAAALRARPRARGRAARALDGRAVRRRRRPDPRDPPVRAPAHLGGAADHHDLRHPLDRGGRADGRPRRCPQGAAEQGARADHHRPSAAAHPRHLAPGTFRRAARACVGNADERGARRRAAAAEHLNKVVRRPTKEETMIRKTCAALALAGALALASGGRPALAQGKKLVIGMPGIPPIFTTVQPLTAEKVGLFKKNGANVELRPFDNGTAAARAVIAGDIDMSMSPTPPVITQVSNTGANLVAIYGWPNADWVLASIDPAKAKCSDMVGQGVGVDSVGGARSVALRS